MGEEPVLEVERAWFLEHSERRAKPEIVRDRGRTSPGPAPALPPAPCVLPGLSEDCFAQVCSDCIATFLNSNSEDGNWYHPYDTYLSATVQVQIEAQAIDNLSVNERTLMPENCGIIYISISNGYPYLTEDTAESEWHEVFGFTDIISNSSKGYGVWITKYSDGDWLLEIVNHPLELVE
ncbi:hypothetical protein KGY73_06010 [bacterium]|nr:hypothetical protein [bacterium]